MDPIANSGALLRDLTQRTIAVGEAAQEADRGVVMLLDEVQFLSPTQLESLISALHRSIQRNLPVTLVGAGLPQIAQLAGEAKSYAERLFTFPVIVSQLWLAVPAIRRACMWVESVPP